MLHGKQPFKDCWCLQCVNQIHCNIFKNAKYAIAGYYHVYDCERYKQKPKYSQDVALGFLQNNRAKRIRRMGWVNHELYVYAAKDMFGNVYFFVSSDRYANCDGKYDYPLPFDVEGPKTDDWIIID